MTDYVLQTYNPAQSQVDFGYNVTMTPIDARTVEIDVQCGTGNNFTWAQADRNARILASYIRPHHDAGAGRGAGGARTEATDTLTVVTLNLWHDQREWPKRLSVILAEMRELRPDVLCLQEVLQHGSLRNQAETLADSLGYHMHFTSVDSAHRVKRYGNAILTRHRVLHAGGKNLDPSNDYRTVAHLRIDLLGRVVDVYDTHLHHTPEGSSIRATQIRDLLAFIDSTRGDGAVVLAGDFNAELETPELRLLARDFVDVFRALHPSATRAEAATFNPIFGGDPGPIDHVFVSKAARTRLAPRACDTMFRNVGPDSVWASDHFGVVARLDVGGRPGQAGGRDGNQEGDEAGGETPVRR